MYLEGPRPTFDDARYILQLQVLGEVGEKGGWSEENATNNEKHRLAFLRARGLRDAEPVDSLTELGWVLVLQDPPAPPPPRAVQMRLEGV